MTRYALQVTRRLQAVTPIPLSDTDATFLTGTGARRARYGFLAVPDAYQFAFAPLLYSVPSKQWRVVTHPGPHRALHVDRHVSQAWRAMGHPTIALLAANQRPLHKVTPSQHLDDRERFETTSFRVVENQFLQYMAAPPRYVSYVQVQGRGLYHLVDDVAKLGTSPFPVGALSGFCGYVGAKEFEIQSRLLDRNEWRPPYHPAPYGFAVWLGLTPATSLPRSGVSLDDDLGFLVRG